MSLVALGSTELIRVYNGLPLSKEARLAEVAQGAGRATINQEYMAAAACLHSTDSKVRRIGIDVCTKILKDELRSGRGEILCPDSHEGMYLLARMGVIAAGYLSTDDVLFGLAEMAMQVTGSEFRIGDLVVDEKGGCRYYPGMRAPNGAGLGRRAMTHLRTETRYRREYGNEKVLHRGPGGRVINLKLDDALIQGPALWMRRILDTAQGRGLEALLRHLSPDAPLPRLKLTLTIHRWKTGSLAYFEDPGPEERPRYVIEGSAAANQERRKGGDGDEDPVDFFFREGTEVLAGEYWERPVPMDRVPANAACYVLPRAV
jgi:hypothetical protein